MDYSKLYEMISAYVDGELTKAEEQSLLDQAAKDPAIEHAIKQERKIKEMVKTRAPRISAPESLRQKVDQLLLAEQKHTGQASNGTGVNASDSKKSMFMYSLAALFLAAAFLVFMYIRTADTESGINSITVEELTSVHYINQEGLLVGERINMSVSEAQTYFHENYGCRITVPELEGATFVAALYTDFFGGFYTPLLQYEVDDDDFIYIFAFEKDDLNKQNRLITDNRAAGAIVKHDDVFIIEVEGLDVVSWKWHDVWYTAVSAHQGDVVAAMLPH